MKRKTSITLSEALVRAVDRQTRKGESRSEVIERLVREGLAARIRHAADAHDRALLDQHADALNAEVADVLDYQGDL